MSWNIQFTERARKELKKLDNQVAVRIGKELKKLSGFDDPAQHCKALTGQYSGLWRYRAGDYRVIIDLDREQLVILALDIDHRSKIYRS